MPASPTNVHDYLMALPESARPFAETLRQTIQAALPHAIETIRYGMPAYRIGDSTVIYFAVWKAHAALYPIYRGAEAFERQVAPFRDKKDTVRLRLDGAPPVDLVTLIVKAQLARVTHADGPVLT
jgi:uncharacterized protein YdhG (YjbR/CyaY superfamily)